MESGLYFTENNIEDLTMNDMRYDLGAQSYGYEVEMGIESQIDNDENVG